jgi:aminomethyltransferase
MSATMAGTTIVSPFHPRTAALNQTTWWYGWNGYLIPDVYTDPFEELGAVREAAAVIDMSPLPKFEISGPDATHLIDYLITRDGTKLDVNQIYFTPLCNEFGKLIADGLVFRIDETTYRLSMDNCFQWLNEQAQGYDVTVQDITADFGLLAIQGPRAQEVLQAATGQDYSDLPFSQRRVTSIAGAEVDLARQGFTGERGYELWVKADDGPIVWKTIWQAGQPFGLQAAGEYAIDIARVEAGLIVISADYTGAGPDPRCADVPVDDENIASPFEMGLGRFVDLDGGDFIGKVALQEEIALGVPRQLVGLKIDWPQIVVAYTERGAPPDISPRVRWDALLLVAGGRQVGRATSITWSPTLNRMIGFGCLETPLVERGASLEIRWPIADDAAMIKAKATDLPFISMKRA